MKSAVPYAMSAAPASSRVIVMEGNLPADAGKAVLVEAK